MLLLVVVPVTSVILQTPQDGEALTSSTDAPWAFSGQNRQNTWYSPQTTIDPADVAGLKLGWSASLPDISGTPIISNGVVYVTGGGNGALDGELTGSIYALNEETGTRLWTHGPGAATDLGFSDIAGVAVDSGDVFATTNGNDLVSLSAATGALNWEAPIDSGLQTNPSAVYTGYQGAPLVWNGEIIVSNTMATSETRGFLRAFSESDGALLWTFYTVPLSPMTSTDQAAYGNSWGSCTYCGGGDNWNVPAIDPHTGIIYFGTGDPAPYYNASQRAPSSSYLDLYTDCVIALNATSGQMIWYYKETPWDTHDWDTGMPVDLFNTTVGGVQTEVVGSGSKSGSFYLLNAQTGSLIYDVTLGIHENTAENPTAGGEVTTPGSNGGVETDYTYDPSTNMLYVTAWNYPESFTATRPDNTIEAGADNSVNEPDNSTVYAIDASTGGVVWTMFLNGLSGGTSSTNDLLFTADEQGDYYALNADTGAVLWTYSSGLSSSGFAANWGPRRSQTGLCSSHRSRTAAGCWLLPSLHRQRRRPAAPLLLVVVIFVHDEEQQQLLVLHQRWWVLVVDRRFGEHPWEYDHRIPYGPLQFRWHLAGDWLHAIRVHAG